MRFRNAQTLSTSHLADVGLCVSTPAAHAELRVMDAKSFLVALRSDVDLTAPRQHCTRHNVMTTDTRSLFMVVDPGRLQH